MKPCWVVQHQLPWGWAHCSCCSGLVCLSDLERCQNRLQLSKQQQSCFRFVGCSWCCAALDGSTVAVWHVVCFQSVPGTAGMHSWCRQYAQTGYETSVQGCRRSCLQEQLGQTALAPNPPQPVGSAATERAADFVLAGAPWCPFSVPYMVVQKNCARSMSCAMCAPAGAVPGCVVLM